MDNSGLRTLTTTKEVSVQPAAQVLALLAEGIADSRPKHQEVLAILMSSSIPQAHDQCRSLFLTSFGRELFDTVSADNKIRCFTITPTHSCKCGRQECQPIKKLSKLTACRHEIENLLRGPG